MRNVDAIVYYWHIKIEFLIFLFLPKAKYKTAL